ncbi:MAG: hypothetical protein R2710_03955 [Acidimicrobiales bacterium]
MFATTDLDIGDVVVHFGGNVVTDRPSTDAPTFLGCDAAEGPVDVRGSKPFGQCLFRAAGQGFASRSKR